MQGYVSSYQQWQNFSTCDFTGKKFQCIVKHLLKNF